MESILQLISLFAGNESIYFLNALKVKQDKNIIFILGKSDWR